MLQEAFKYLGKNKSLQKISKESYYYTETLRNFKTIFADKHQAEETALTILNKVPAFAKFVQQNSMLASLFGPPGSSGSTLGAGGLSGLQTRASVNALIQNQIAAGGPNARQTIQQNIQQAQGELTKLKDKILKAGGGSSDTEMPDFKPNMQKTKTFLQRLEYGANFQSVKSNSLIPGGADVGLSVGYKINEKSVAGIGASYKLGLGSIDKIKFSHEGIGLRSFMDWKIPSPFGGAGGGLFVSGGFEVNYNASFKKIAELRNANAWQQAGLLGISKKMVVKSKLMKGTKISLLYDFLWRHHVVNQPVVFRVGYNFK